MIKIKISTPWSHTDYNTRLPFNQYPGYKFYFDESKEDFDYWIIWGGIKDENETAFCPPENIIYLTDEVHEERFFNKYFLSQFASIITCRTDLTHRYLIPSHELNTWIVDKDFDCLYSTDYISKSKMLSVVCSDHTWLPGHKERFAFVNKIIGHFKDRIDVFGRGFNPIEDKYDALAPYKYSIAIENSVIPGYFTEKIADCYLTHTMPIYYGCPDIEKYFDPLSFHLINPLDYKTSIDTIEKIIEEDCYEDFRSLIVSEKKNYLQHYHIFSSLIKILERNFSKINNKQLVTIKNEQCYSKGYYLNKAITNIHRMFSLPGRFYFSVYFDQGKTFANRK